MSDDVGRGMSRIQRRDWCRAHGCVWTVLGCPPGTQRCRRCARFERLEEEIDWGEDLIEQTVPPVVEPPASGLFDRIREEWDRARAS